MLIPTAQSGAEAWEIPFSLQGALAGYSGHVLSKAIILLHLGTHIVPQPCHPQGCTNLAPLFYPNGGSLPSLKVKVLLLETTLVPVPWSQKASVLLFHASQYHLGKHAKPCSVSH